MAAAALEVKEDPVRAIFLEDLLDDHLTRYSCPLLLYVDVPIVCRRTDRVSVRTDIRNFGAT